MAEEMQDSLFLHQYMCSECGTLYNTLEEVLVHQQDHVGDTYHASDAEGPAINLGQLQGLAAQNHFQCLECGEFVLSPNELLQHQETHTRVSSQPTSQRDTQSVLGSQIHYQCCECKALFTSPEVWLAHQRAHVKEPAQNVVLQTENGLQTMVHLQNAALGDGSQESQEIYGVSEAVLQGQPESPEAPTQGYLHDAQSEMQQTLPVEKVSPSEGQQSSHIFLPAVQVKQEYISEMEMCDQDPESVEMHPYECSECTQLFQTPEEFLDHQGMHFLEMEKETGECPLYETTRHEVLYLGAFQPSAREGLRIVSTENDPGDVGGFHSSQKRLQIPGSQPENMKEEGRVMQQVFRCTHCEASFASSVEMKKHRKGHAAESFLCTDCNRLFTSANRLQTHQKVHVDGTHECPNCYKVFKKAVTLEQHMRIHSGEALYLCVDCGLAFGTEMTLVVHRKTHTANPLHRCECGKTFSNMTKFLYHRRTHSGKSGVPQVKPEKSKPQRELLEVVAPPALPPHQEEPVEGPCVTVSAEADSTAPEAVECLTPVEDTPILSSEPPPVVQVNGSGEEPLQQVVTSDTAKCFQCPQCKKEFSSHIRMVRHKRIVHILERKHKCQLCGKKFKKLVHVKNHMRIHTGERPFQCTECGKTFTSLANLMRHNLTHTGERPYQCDVCHKTFSQSSNLQQHRMLHGGISPFSCKECGLTFSRASKLALHLYRHTGELPFKCKECDKSFLRRRLLELHHFSHLGKELHHCKDCGAIFVHLSKQEEHQCSQKRHYECSICGKMMNSQANLTLHELVHAGQRPFKCQQCSKTFSSQSGLTRHQQRHSGARPHQCGVCAKTFVASSGLQLHYRTHTNERPFPCSVCGKAFRQATHLREHRRLHTGERPYKCDECGKNFVQSMHLAEHRRIHTGERPHSCQECGKAFKTLSNLRSHRKTHGEPPPQPQQTIMCNEFGEPIAIIETSGPLPLAETIEIYQATLDGNLQVEKLQVENIHVNTFL